MVTSTMVTLSPEVREAGWNLYQQLKTNNFPFSAMFWADFDEDDWRIFLATPLIDTLGPLKIYGQIRECISRLSPNDRAVLEPSDIVAVRPTDRLVRRMRERYGIVPGDQRIPRRVSLNYDEAYVYEMRDMEEVAPVREAVAV